MEVLLWEAFMDDGGTTQCTESRLRARRSLSTGLITLIALWICRSCGLDTINHSRPESSLADSPTDY